MNMEMRNMGSEQASDAVREKQKELIEEKKYLLSEIVGDPKKNLEWRNAMIEIDREKHKDRGWNRYFIHDPDLRVVRNAFEGIHDVMPGFRNYRPETLGGTGCPGLCHKEGEDEHRHHEPGHECQCKKNIRHMDVLQWHKIDPDEKVTFLGYCDREYWEKRRRDKGNARENYSRYANGY